MSGPRRENVARNARILRLRREGKSFGQIAEMTGEARGVVAGVCWRAGLCEFTGERNGALLGGVAELPSRERLGPSLRAEARP